MKIEEFHPDMLKRPLDELRLDQDQQEGIQISGAEALLPKEPEEGEGTSPASEEGGKVPYRRFKKFHDRAIEAERDTEFWRQKALQPQERQEQRNFYQPPAPNQYVEPTYQGPDWDRFKALFAGAEEAAVKDAYRLEVQRTAAIEERAMQRAQEVFQQHSQAQRQEQRANRSFLDNWTDEASDLVGRDLSENEQVALLDIMDEFSVKDEDGRIEAPMSPEQALRIYQMQTSGHSQRRAVRNAVAQISTASAGGETSAAQTTRENAEKFNPQLGWRANFRRLTGRDPETA